MSLRVVIVDDEPLARERVRTFLAESRTWRSLRNVRRALKP
jgi:DNA-binding NarL/FixJ family response regulator